MISRFGPYRIDRLLGQGGMGEVYRAWDEVRLRWVALKVLDARYAADDDMRRRFQREAEIAGSLHEPHVIPVHDFGVIDGKLYLDMRLVEGPDLATEIRRTGRLGAHRTVALLGQVGRALDAAHAAGLVHRDVKPSNILVAADDFAYVVDFGIARRRDNVTSTASTAIPGTLAYLAPERLRGEAAEPASDVYALGCVLHECLTGERPFPSDNVAEIVTAHLETVPPRPGDTVTAAAAFDEVVARAMSKVPAARYPDCDALVRAMTTALGATAPTSPGAGPIGSVRDEPPRPSPPRSPTRILPRSRRHRRTTRTGTRPAPMLASTRTRSVLVAAALALLVILVAVGGRLLVGGGTTVGLSPVAVAVSADGARVTVIGTGSRTATVLDARRRSVIDRVELGGPAVGGVAGTRTDRVFVVTTTVLRSDVVVLDPRTGSVVSAFRLPERGTGRPALDAQESRLFVPGDDGVQVVDLALGREVGTLPGRTAVVAGGDGPDVAVTATGAALRVWDPVAGIVTAEIPLGTAALDVVHASGATFFVAGSDPERAVIEVDVATRQIVAVTALAGGAERLAPAPDGRRLYVAVNASPPWLAAVDIGSRTVVGRYPLEPHTGRVALAVAPGGSPVYVANTDLGTLTVDDTGS